MKYLITCISCFIFTINISAQVPSGSFVKDMKDLSWQSAEYIVDAKIFTADKIFIKRCGAGVTDSCNTPGFSIKGKVLVIRYSDFTSTSHSYKYDSSERTLTIYMEDKTFLRYKVSIIREEYGYLLTRLK